VIKFVGDFRQVSVFFQELRLISTNKADRHDITEILMKVALYTDRKLKQNQIKAEFVHKTQCKLSEENLNSYGHNQQLS
jgi:hypothetical protein